jgi:hypothetical protein
VLDLELQRRRERRRKGNEVLELFSLRPTVAAELSICLRWKFEDPVAKAPLETNVAEVNKSILCSLFVLFVFTTLWSELSLLMRVHKPVLPLYIS